MRANAQTVGMDSGSAARYIEGELAALNGSAKQQLALLGVLQRRSLDQTSDTRFHRARFEVTAVESWARDSVPGSRAETREPAKIRHRW
jgi:hypothetical protein